uniref:Uncharacterized protein n=1 Tax=Aegilops tauschii subsp. strangulata TaxID=200361 RepID=A0A453K6M5_AEGTS
MLSIYEFICIITALLWCDWCSYLSILAFATFSVVSFCVAWRRKNLIIWSVHWSYRKIIPLLDS